MYVPGGIVAGAATGVLTRPTQRLFKLDRFEIDPIFTGSGPVDVRSTFGKQITPDVLVTYSQSFDSTKEPIFRVDWWISESIVLQGRRDENGIGALQVAGVFQQLGLLALAIVLMMALVAVAGEDARLCQVIEPVDRGHGALP